MLAVSHANHPNDETVRIKVLELYRALTDIRRVLYIHTYYIIRLEL